MRDLTNSDMATELSCNEDRINNLNRGRTQFYDHERDKISKLMNELDMHEIAYLKGKYKEALKDFIDEKNFEANEVLRVMMGRTFSWKNSYIDDNCAGKHNGVYALIRVGYNDRVYISRMLIAPSRNGLPPQFLTSRKTSLGNYKKVRGVIFRYGEEILTIGQIKNREGLRMTRMNIIRRSDRYDFCGLRLGMSTKVRLPYAHRIYAYQLKKPRTGEDRAQIYGCHEYENLSPVKENIGNIEEIIDLLKVREVEENGIISRLAE